MSYQFAQIASWTEFEDQEKLGLGLEGVVQVDDEWVSHVGKDVSFGLGVSYEVLTQDLSLAQSLHGVQLARVLVSYEVNVSKTT